MITWATDLTADEWDSQLADMHGHPLQSAMWGDARRVIDGIEDHRWAAFSNGRLALMARFEVRPISLIGKAAWMPRGPVESTDPLARRASAELLDRLRSHGYLLCIDDRYVGTAVVGRGTPLLPKPRTVCVNLSAGREAVWKALDPTMRYGVRTAEKGRAVVEQSTDSRDIVAFCALCTHVGKLKDFDPNASESLFQILISGPSNRDVGARLFVARSGQHVTAGAIVLRCGTSLHYFWGAVDRKFSKLRTSEAVQWRVMEWAMDEGIERYDLEGIDPERNPGTYQFKMKMGAVEVDLPGRHAYALTTLGKLVLAAGRRLGRI